MPSYENKGTIATPHIGDRHRGVFIGKGSNNAWHVWLGCEACDHERWVLERNPMPKYCVKCSRGRVKDMGNLGRR